MTQEQLEAVYARIGDATPLKSDCGVLCGAACCKSDGETTAGVALLPVEAEFLKNVPWAKIGFDDAMNAPMLDCREMCARELRPFLCRIFPLCPSLNEDGSLRALRIDARARAVCPLCRSGIRGLDASFVQGVKQSCRLLLQDEEGRAFLKRWAEIEEEYRKPLF